MQLPIKTTSRYVKIETNVFFIPVIRRVKGVTRFVGKYVKEEGSVSNPKSIYILN